MRNYSFVNLIIAIVDFVFGIIILGLGLRLILRLFDANPESGFVDFIYDSTAPLLEPFRNIFSPYTIEPGNVLEVSTLFAIVVYLIAAYLITEFLTYISFNSTKYRTTTTRIVS